MSRGIRFFWLANLVFFLVAPHGLWAQELPNGPTFRLTSRLVYIDVVVRDKSGQVVQGLTQQDFKVEEDGKLQKVDFFERHILKQAAPSPWRQPLAPAQPQFLFTNIANRETASGAINIILFDLLNTPRSDLTLRPQTASQIPVEVASGAKCSSLCSAESSADGAELYREFGSIIGSGRVDQAQ